MFSKGEYCMALVCVFLLCSLRGTFEIGSQSVLSAQYYEEIPFYGPPAPIDDSSFPPTKFFEWKVVDGPKVRCNNYM